MQIFLNICVVVLIWPLLILSVYIGASIVHRTSRLAILNEKFANCGDTQSTVTLQAEIDKGFGETDTNGHIILWCTLASFLATLILVI